MDAENTKRVNEQTISGRWCFARRIWIAPLLAIALAILVHAGASDLDPSFDVDGILTNNSANASGVALAIQPDSRIVVLGNTDSGPKLWRYLTSGGLDASFGLSGVVAFPETTVTAAALVLQADGGIVIVGVAPDDTGYQQIRLRRYTSVGAADPTFGIGGAVAYNGPGGTIVQHGVASMAIQADGKIVLAGTALDDTTVVPGFPTWLQSLLSIVRFNANGTLDTTFGPGGEVLYAGSITTQSFPDDVSTNGVVIRSDGRIVVAGDTGGGAVTCLWSYLPSGAIDTTFGFNGIAKATLGYVRDAAIQSDGKIVVTGGPSGGPITTSRFNTSGSLDASFGIGGVDTYAAAQFWPAFGLGTGSFANAVALQSDGKIVVGAPFPTPGTDTPGGNLAILRYNSNGILDTTFNGSGVLVQRNPEFVPFYFFPAVDVAVQTDNKIVALGTSVSGLTIWRFGATLPSGITVAFALDPADSTATVTPPYATASSDSFVEVVLNGGGITSGTLQSATNNTGAGANYSLSLPLLSSGDTATVFIWTALTQGGVLAQVRSDTSMIDTQNLPQGVPQTDTGLRAFTNSVFQLEFLDASGNIIGDTRTTSNVGASYSYTVCFTLSETTTALWAAAGFDTSTGGLDSPALKHFNQWWIADTFGGAWRVAPGATVTVTSLSGGARMRITVSGLTTDLPGGLGGGAVSSAAGAGNKGACLIERMSPPSFMLTISRFCRDNIIMSVLGRFLVQAYYMISGLV